MVPGDDDSGEKPGDPPASAGEGETTESTLGDMPKAVRQRLEAFIPDLVRRAFTSGMGAVFSTEEGIRKLTKDLTLPKDVAGYLASTASSTKDQIFEIVAREVREFLSGVNLSEEIAKMLTTLSLEVKTEIRFIPNDEKYAGVEPDVKAKVRLKRAEDRQRKSSSRIRIGRRLRGRTPPDEGGGKP
ncbi:MAG TPA: hypothetical protein VL172_19505 [Kofleriaceae bacterium]|nr:hypothetical protein [Kofleriaceae bacterium]